MRLFRMVVASASLLGMIGIAGAQEGYRYHDDGYRYSQRDDGHRYRERDAREQARFDLHRRLDRCGASHYCRRRAYRHYRHDLARIERHRF